MQRPCLESFICGLGGNSQTYFVTVASFLVGESKIPMGSDVLFDTGTSYTYLASSTYSSVLQAVSLL